MLARRSTLKSVKTVPRCSLATRVSRICCQGGADQFRVVAGVDMAVRIGRRGPRALPFAKGRGGFQQMGAADLPVSLGRELRPDQVPSVGEEKHSIAAWRKVDARAVSKLRHGVRRPNLIACSGFQTHEFA